MFCGKTSQISINLIYVIQIRDVTVKPKGFNSSAVKVSIYTMQCRRQSSVTKDFEPVLILPSVYNHVFWTIHDQVTRDIQTCP